MKRFGFETSKISDNHSHTEEQSVPKFIDYEEQKQLFSLSTLALTDSFIELSNEGSDVYFALDELRKKDTSLFYASMGFLGLSLLTRLIIALLPLIKICKGKLKFKENNRRWYFLGLIVSLIEPMMGTAFINKSLSDEGGDLYDTESEMSSKFKRQREESRGLMYNSFGMIVLEDIPELIIEFAYLIRSGGNIENMPLFVITTLLSLWHFFRVVSEIWFERKQLKHIPNPNNYSKSNITIVDGRINKIKERWKQRKEICHKICYLELRKFDNDGLMNNFATFMVKYSGSLGRLHLEDNQIVNIDNLGKALETNKTLEILDLHNNQIVNIDNLAKALETNKTLEELYLHDNKISEADKQKIKNIWGKRRNLHI